MQRGPICEPQSSIIVAVYFVFEIMNYKLRGLQCDEFNRPEYKAARATYERVGHSGVSCVHPASDIIVYQGNMTIFSIPLLQ